MAKKRRSGKKDNESKRRAKPAADQGSDLPPRRVLEQFMRQMFGGESSPSGRVPLVGQAEDLVYRAMEEPDPRQQVALARQALDLWPDCADAYTLLAENAATRKEGLALYEQAIAAGQRAIDPEAFQRDVGNFWGLLDTRPYMRARLGLADTLWGAGRREDAIGHLWDMLRLNVSDNQGVRYVLAGWLLNLGRDDELRRLLAEFADDGSANWAYTRALLAFRQAGDSPQARQLLQEANKINKHAFAYLAGDKPLPSEQPSYYTIGDENEAILYAGSALGGWKSTPGAAAWLRACLAKKTDNVSVAQGPLPLVKERLKRLPQQADVWETGSRRIANWVVIAGQRVRPWMVLVVSETHDLVVAHDILEQEPTAAHLWDVLSAAMLKPVAGKAHRPSEIRIAAESASQELQADLADLEIDCAVSASLPDLDAVFEDLGRHIAGQGEPALLDTPGVTPKLLRGFYLAAADFYRAAVWHQVGFNATIQVQSDRFEDGPWYAVIMGQSGITFGLTLYEDLEFLTRVQRGEVDDEENARETVALTVTYGDESEVPVADAQAIEEHDFTLASAEAYPAFFRKEKGLSLRPPLPWEVELMEGCLRALPRFLARHPSAAPGEAAVTVPAAGGELSLTLSWVEESG